MKLTVKKTYLGLLPASRGEFDKLETAKFIEGELYEVEIHKKRNIKFHRKFFALINLCYENQEYYNDIEDLRKELVIDAGFSREVVTHHGEIKREALSLSFSSMDEIQFEDVYNKVLTQVMLMLDCNNDDINEQLKNF